MITISLCMIVKNEERILARCLDSVADLVDEIIIVDTGSQDATKEIAGKYGAKLFDFAWVDDFSAARNFAFSKAGCDYIYSADADEVLSEENRERFRTMKETLLPEIEIVQMKYGNQLEHGSVYNFDEEYRPKLFKRQREFVWEEPIHETVRLAPVVYDSDIVITHLPLENHAGRDLANFAKQCEMGVRLSRRLLEFYARELMMAGSKEDFVLAGHYFASCAADVTRDAEEVAWSAAVVTRAARLAGDVAVLMKYSSKGIAGEGNSETCLELGLFYEEKEDLEEAAIWFYNAVYETKPILKLTAGGKEPLEGLIRIYEKMGRADEAESYRRELETR